MWLPFFVGVELLCIIFLDYGFKCQQLSKSSIGLNEIRLVRLRHELGKKHIKIDQTNKTPEPLGRKNLFFYDLNKIDHIPNKKKA